MKFQWRNRLQRVQYLLYIYWFSGALETQHIHIHSRAHVPLIYFIIFILPACVWVVWRDEEKQTSYSRLRPFRHPIPWIFPLHCWPTPIFFSLKFIFKLWIRIRCEKKTTEKKRKKIAVFVCQSMRSFACISDSIGRQNSATPQHCKRSPSFVHKIQMNTILIALAAAIRMRRDVVASTQDNMISGVTDWK